jgi:hypothetical protein
VKLGSYLSGETQLLAYCDSFSDQKLQEFYVSTSAAATGNKMLLFIAPSTTIGPSLRTTDEHCKSKYGVSFQSHCEHKGIRFQWLTWEEIVSDLDGSDMLQKELQLLVEDFINKELTMEEIKVLANPDIPSSLLKLFGFIQDVKSHLDGNGVRTYRMSQSYNFFGFMLEATGFKGYFGYFLPLWEKHKTPLGLQVREEWIKEGGGKILDSLRDAEFRKEQDHEWVKMFDLQTLPNLKQDLLSTIRQVDKRVA